MDTLVLVLTWIKTYRQWELSRELDVKAPISTYLIRDGEFRHDQGTWQMKFIFTITGTMYFVYVPSAR